MLFSALALTLPVICGQAQYPKEGSRKRRYIDWYDKHIGQYEQCHCPICKQYPTSYLSGEVVYGLKNSMLHQGTPNINSSEIKDLTNKIDSFELVIESKKDVDVYADVSGVMNSLL